MNQTSPSKPGVRVSVQDLDDVATQPVANGTVGNKPPNLERATSLVLPSNFNVYGERLTSFHVNPITGYHQAKFSRAAKEKSLTHVLDAVNSLTVENASNGYDIRDLSIPDFYYVLYWLRLNNYTKTKLTQTGYCQDPKHIHRVYGLPEDDAEHLDESTLTNVLVVDKTNLKEEEFTQAQWDQCVALQEEAASSYLNGSPYFLSYARIGDSETLEASKTGEEIAFLADYASFLRSDDPQADRFENRIDFVGKLTPDEIEHVLTFRDLASSYGVKEVIRFKCKECGVVNESPVSISAHNFF